MILILIIGGAWFLFGESGKGKIGVPVQKVLPIESEFHQFTQNEAWQLMEERWNVPESTTYTDTLALIDSEYEYKTTVYPEPPGTLEIGLGELYTEVEEMGTVKVGRYSWSEGNELSFLVLRCSSIDSAKQVYNQMMVFGDAEEKETDWQPSIGDASALTYEWPTYSLLVREKNVIAGITAKGGWADPYATSAYGVFIKNRIY